MCDLSEARQSPFPDAGLDLWDTWKELVCHVFGLDIALLSMQCHTATKEKFRDRKFLRILTGILRITVSYM